MTHCNKIYVIIFFTISSVLSISSCLPDKNPNILTESTPGKTLAILGTLSQEANAETSYRTKFYENVTYTWTFPSGTVITKGKGTYYIEVTIGSTGGEIKVVGSNGKEGTATLKISN